MRLYLSSQGLGTASDRLVTLMRGGRRIGVIANAADDVEAGRRAVRLSRAFSDLERLGLEPVEIDLRDHFHDEGVRSRLVALDALWTLGGNVLALRTALWASGADAAIATRLADDSIVYAGYSAGACVLGPREALRVAEFEGGLPGYPESVVRTGMGLLPYAIVPHHRDQAVSAPAGIEDHYIHHHVPFIALRDGQAIVVDGEEMRVVE